MAGDVVAAEAAVVQPQVAPLPLRLPLLQVTALLVALLIPGIGREVNGARRWIPLGFATFQPSELMKLFVVLYAADYTVRKAAFTIFQCKAVLDSDRRLMAGSNMGHSVVNRTLAHLDPAHLDLAGVRNRWDGVSSSGADNSASFHNRT